LIENAVKMNFFNNLSGRRLFNEIILILQEERVIPLIKRMSKFDLLKLIHPKIVLSSHMSENLERIEKVFAWFKLLFLDENYDQWILYFGGLIDALKKDEVKTVIENLSLTRVEIKKIELLKEKVPKILSKICSTTIKPSDVYHLLNPLPLEVQLYVMAKTTAENTRRAISHYFTHTKQVKIELSGNDLIALGLTPGKVFKKILNATLDAKIDGILKNREDEMRFVKDNYLPKMN
jgi:tRNA nucleotidyltransferase (CCA-adding enzyme)